MMCRSRKANKKRPVERIRISGSVTERQVFEKPNTRSRERVFGFARAVGQVNSDSGSSVVYCTDALSGNAKSRPWCLSRFVAFGRLALGVEGIPYSLV